MFRVTAALKVNSQLMARQFGVSAVVANKAVDPIQKLFLDKINEYNSKIKASGGKIPDMSPEMQKELQTELDRVARQYGGGKGEDLTKFPGFTFPEPKVDPINLQQSS